MCKEWASSPSTGGAGIERGSASLRDDNATTAPHNTRGEGEELEKANKKEREEGGKESEQNRKEKGRNMERRKQSMKTVKMNRLLGGRK